MGIYPLWPLHGVSGQLSFLHSRWTKFSQVKRGAVDCGQSYPQLRPQLFHTLSRLVHSLTTGLSTGRVAVSPRTRETVRPVDYKWGWCDRLQGVEGAR